MRKLPALISSLVVCATVIVQADDVRFVDFTTPGGIKCRLTAEGDSMWRVRTAGPDGSFAEVGAVQALARWMGESLRPEPQPLRKVTASDGTSTFISPDRTRAVLAADGSSVVFFSSAGRKVVEVTRVVTGEKCSLLAGRLARQEAVYGLGERLDRLNKRGTRVPVFTRDGYNDSSASYVAIPIFSTTRGGGVFVNAYEPMTADFGATVSDEWRMEIGRAAVDAYVIATDLMRDVPNRYMKLAGFPSVPDAWQFGPVVCRYAPDFAAFHGPTSRVVHGYLTLGQGLKNVVDKYREMGALPTAVIAEGRSCEIFGNTPETQARNRAEFMKGVDYLAKDGIRYMIYMAMGSSVLRSAPGFRPDYNVHVTVTDAAGKVKRRRTDLIPYVTFKSKNPDVRKNHKGCRYLDITDPEAWQWYLDQVWQPLLDLGVRGAKIDFCEEMPDDGALYGSVRFRYHWKHPEVFEGAAVHHAYPSFFIAKLCRDLTARLRARGQGSFMALSRGGGIGVQRAPFLWAGDQKRHFEKLDDHLFAMLNSGVSGVPFMTYDMAGYHYTEPEQTPVAVRNRVTGAYDLTRTVPGPDEEIVYRRYSADVPHDAEQRVFLRGLEFTAYSPCIQTHGYVRHPYEFDDATRACYVSYAAKHLALADEIAEASRKAARTGIPVVRPLVWDYQYDMNTWDIEDEYLFCDRYLVAPVLNDATSREVYLPQGIWIEEGTGKRYEVGVGGKRIMMRVPIDSIPVFKREEKPRLAFQVYAVRDMCEDDFPATLRAVKALGYEGVETGRFYGRSAKEIRSLMDEVGLELVALQLYPDDLTEPKLHETLRFTKECGTDRINVAWFKGSAENRRDWQLLVNVVNHAAEVAAKEGITIGYHNHDQEFLVKFDGKYVWDWLWERFSPLVKQEFDAGWCALAGVDPHEVLRRYPNRNPTVHVMPAIADASGLVPGMAGVGSVRDKVDWRRLTAELAADGTKWFVVKPVTFPGSAEDLKSSFEYLKENVICKSKRFNFLHLLFQTAVDNTGAFSYTTRQGD